MADAALTRAEHDLQVASERFRSRLVRIALVTVGVDLVAGALALWGESSVKDHFATYFDALFWTSTQLLTVSSSLPNPDRPPTKLLDVGLELYAIVVVSSLAGTFADLLHHRTRGRSDRLWRESR
jgi:TctA family transporter